MLSALGDVAVVKFCRHTFDVPYETDKKSNGVVSWFLLVYSTSWFVNYCASRTLVNSFEMALTNLALGLYPAGTRDVLENRGSAAGYVCLISLSFCVRPTTALFWLPLVISHALVLLR